MAVIGWQADIILARTDSNFSNFMMSPKAEKRKVRSALLKFRSWHRLASDLSNQPSIKLTFNLGPINNKIATPQNQ